MKNYDFWEKVFMSLAALSSIGSAVINFMAGTSYTWQLMVLVWVVICYIKQLRIENMEDKK